jgi:hypothetical protein
MSNENDIFTLPKTEELPRGIPDVASILFRCYDEGLTEEEALHECRSAGANDITVQDVEEAFKALSNAAKWLDEKVVPYLRQNGG